MAVLVTVDVMDEVTEDVPEDVAVLVAEDVTVLDMVVVSLDVKVEVALEVAVLVIEEVTDVVTVVVCDDWSHSKNVPSSYRRTISEKSEATALQLPAFSDRMNPPAAQRSVPFK